MGADSEGLLIGPLDRETLEFTGVVELPTGFGQDLVYAGGLVWTIDAENAYGVRPQAP